MKIAITGPTGFVGTHLVSDLKKNAFEVVLIDRKSIYGSDLHLKFNDCDVVIHTAGKAHATANLNDYDVYDQMNFQLTKHVFDAFAKSSAKKFIYLSSIGAICNSSHEIIDEESSPAPLTNYGKSKLKSEQYIMEQSSEISKRVYIFRPTLIYGKGCKGNLELLIRYLSKYPFWPLGSYNNNRSLCGMETLLVSTREFIILDSIPSGIYIICDDDPISLTDLVRCLSHAIGRTSYILYIPKFLISFLSFIGDFTRLPFNSTVLKKITEPLVVSNKKLKSVLSSKYIFNTKTGIFSTFSRNEL